VQGSILDLLFTEGNQLPHERQKNTGHNRCILLKKIGNAAAEVYLNKTVLVVGGAGYIGSYANKYLAQKGYKTIVLDNLSRGDLRACLYGEFIEADFADKDALNSLFSKKKIDAVIHFAAFTDVGESVKNPAKYYENNVAKTIVLLNAMVANDIRYFLFSSSAAIFGLCDKLPINELTPKQPINPYGESKWMVEKILQDYAAAYPFYYASLRYFNAAGADPEGEIKIWKQTQTNLIPKALHSLLEPNGKVRIFGTDYPTSDGTGIRDYIHIYDLAKAHVLALEKIMKENTSAAYNLGNGNGFSVRQVLCAIEKVTKRKLQVEEVEKRPGDPAILIADSTLAAKELGFKPKYKDIETIVLHSWEAMQLPQICPA